MSTGIAQFISIEDEEDGIDLILSFALYDDALGVKSLMLLRTPQFEVLLPYEERGVSVSLQGDDDYYYDINSLEKFSVAKDIVTIKSSRKTYRVDISRVDGEDKSAMVEIIGKMNFDSRFEVNIA